MINSLAQRETTMFSRPMPCSLARIMECVKTTNRKAPRRAGLFWGWWWFLVVIGNCWCRLLALTSLIRNRGPLTLHLLVTRPRSGFVNSWLQPLDLPSAKAIDGVQLYRDLVPSCLLPVKPLENCVRASGQIFSWTLSLYFKLLSR